MHTADTYTRRAHVLNDRNLVAYISRLCYQLLSVVSAPFDIPRRSSSRSVRQLMKERELLIRSVVNLILAAGNRVNLVDCDEGIELAPGYRMLVCVGLLRFVAAVELVLKFIGSPR